MRDEAFANIGIRSKAGIAALADASCDSAGIVIRHRSANPASLHLIHAALLHIAVCAIADARLINAAADRAQPSRHAGPQERTEIPRQERGSRTEDSVEPVVGALYSIRDGLADSASDR